MNTHLNNNKIVKQLALNSGFDFCGIAKAEKLDEEARKLENWLNKNRHGKMHYMQNHFDLRVDPTRLVPGAKSVITVLKNYYTTVQQNEKSPQISMYAYGNDYHKVIKEKLKQFLISLQSKFGQVQGRGFVDSAPVLERAWAVKSGLGWVGKNGNFITKKNGSYFFIATLITDLEIEIDVEYKFDYCGTCTQCIDACPTQAILPQKEIDAQKCIAYFTIELKDEFIEDKFKKI